MLIYENAITYFAQQNLVGIVGLNLFVSLEVYLLEKQDLENYT